MAELELPSELPSEPVLKHWRSVDEVIEYTVNCIYEYNNILFDTLITSEVPSDYDTALSTEYKFLRRLKACSSCDGDDERDETLMNEVWNRAHHRLIELVLTVGKSKMKTIAQNMDSPAEKAFLPSWMHPKTVNLQLLTEERQLVVIEREDLPIYNEHEPFTNSEIMDMNLPHHNVSDLEVVDGILYRSVYKVNVNGQTLIAKLAKKRSHEAMIEEIRKLADIKDQNSAGSSISRVAELKGLICSPEGIVGILLANIPSIGDDLGMMIRRSKQTRDIEDSTESLPILISQTRKDKWLKQITETVQELHAHNIVWGGVNLDNVLIHEATDDAWVVDFGKGRKDAPLQQWVDRSIHGTKAGDLHGLQHITTELAGSEVEAVSVLTET
jgi:serine/threonine protein kinase